MGVLGPPPTLLCPSGIGRTLEISVCEGRSLHDWKLLGTRQCLARSLQARPLPELSNLRMAAWDGLHSWDWLQCLSAIAPCTGALDASRFSGDPLHRTLDPSKCVSVPPPSPHSFAASGTGSSRSRAVCSLVALLPTALEGAKLAWLATSGLPLLRGLRSTWQLVDSSPMLAPLWSSSPRLTAPHLREEPAAPPWACGLLACPYGLQRTSQGCTTNGVPTGVISKSTFTSSLAMRMQPALSSLPMLSGSQVPWKP